jgi:hypothetical protein
MLVVCCQGSSDHTAEVTVALKLIREPTGKRAVIVFRGLFCFFLGKQKEGKKACKKLIKFPKIQIWIKMNCGDSIYDNYRDATA